MFDEMPQEKRARTDAGGEDPPESSWAGLHADALGVVLRFLPCLADRARVRAVCRQWRDAARGRGVAPPLPLLVLPRFGFAGLTPGGVLSAARRAWMPPGLEAGNAYCVGSSDAWLVGAAGQAVGECFMVNAFSHEVRRLPHLGTYDCSLRRVALSASPESEPDRWIAVAFMIRWSRPVLALWRPGMRSWRVCHHALFAGHVDIAFHQGRLYMLWRFTPCLFAFELGGDEFGVTISRMRDCFIERALPRTLVSAHELSCNMVEWHGRLLLIIRYNGHGGHQARHRVKVRVFAMDLSANRSAVTEIHSFGSDCIFVGSGGCKSFPAGQHSGVEGDRIYFGPDHYNPRDAFVYSMRDGRTGPIFPPSPCITHASERSLGFPVWLFPSE
jgi:hypothetical protein